MDQELGSRISVMVITFFAFLRGAWDDFNWTRGGIAWIQA